MAVAAGWAWEPIGSASSANGDDGDADATDGWRATFNRDEQAVMSGPPSSLISSANLLHFKGDSSKVTFRLVWGPNPTSSDALPAPSAAAGTAYPNPPAGLKPAGEGLDPGLFDIDYKTGSISALPRRVGNFSMYLLANDGAGTAAHFGLAGELDQVVVRRWDFNVVGKPNFEVMSYTRIQPGKLPAGSTTDAPYAAARKIRLLNCTVGTTYRIAPIDTETFAYKHASGGAGAKVRFTIRDPPPGSSLIRIPARFKANPKPRAFAPKDTQARCWPSTPGVAKPNSKRSNLIYLSSLSLTLWRKQMVDAHNRGLT